MLYGTALNWEHLACRTNLQIAGCPTPKLVAECVSHFCTNGTSWLYVVHRRFELRAPSCRTDLQIVVCPSPKLFAKCVSNLCTDENWKVRMPPSLYLFDGLLNFFERLNSASNLWTLDVKNPIKTMTYRLRWSCLARLSLSCMAHIICWPFVRAFQTSHTALRPLVHRAPVSCSFSYGRSGTKRPPFGSEYRTTGESLHTQATGPWQETGPLLWEDRVEGEKPQGQKTDVEDLFQRIQKNHIQEGVRRVQV